MNKVRNPLNKKRKRAFTLVEIIISMAIIGIIVVPFLAMFTSSFSTIFSMGHKTEASNEAQAFIESVYNGGISEITNVALAFNSTEENDPANMNNTLYDPSGLNKQIYHNVDTSGTQPKVTVMVFYQNGSRLVKLSALVP